ncbi:MAG: Uma2 family endonuclease [Planctomycetota bacterium]
MSANPTQLTAEVEYALGVARFMPDQGSWTLDAYLEATDGIRGVEFVDGRLEFLPMASEIHQAIIELFFDLIREAIRRRGEGKARLAGLRVSTGEKRIREPDIVVLLDSKDPRRRNRYWRGADLAVEVVSDDAKDRVRDYETKFQEYAAAGFAEYWIIDYQEDLVLVNRLVGDRYEEAGRYTRGDVAKSVLLEGFEVGVDQLFAEADNVPE